MINLEREIKFWKLYSNSSGWWKLWRKLEIWLKIKTEVYFIYICFFINSTETIFIEFDPICVLIVHLILFSNVKRITSDTEQFAKCIFWEFDQVVFFGFLWVVCFVFSISSFHFFLLQFVFSTLSFHFPTQKSPFWLQKDDFTTFIQQFPFSNSFFKSKKCLFEAFIQNYFSKNPLFTLLKFEDDAAKTEFLTFDATKNPFPTNTQRDSQNNSFLVSQLSSSESQTISDSQPSIDQSRHYLTLETHLLHNTNQQ